MQQADDATPQPSPTTSFTEAFSTRSRASSIISTGTKTSITTLPQPPPPPETHSGPIDVVLGRRNFRITARPGSILSISSYDHPLPPYTESAPLQPPTDVGDSGPAQASNPILAPTPRRPTTATTDASDATDATAIPSSGSPLPSSPSPPSPPMSPMSSSTNALSAHYTSVVRTIDSNHAAEVATLKAQHASALSKTRHDIDAAYRITLRTANQRIERVAEETRAEMRAEFAPEKAKLEERIRELEGEVEGRLREMDALRHLLDGEELRRTEEVRRARNEVEDVWEGRWRDRMRLAAEEVRNAWEDGERVGNAWERAVRGRWPESFENVKEDVVRMVGVEKGGRRASSSGSQVGSG